MQQEKQVEMLIVSDFVNEMYVLTDKFAELVENRSTYLSDEKIHWVNKVVDYIDNAIEKMVKLVNKAEGFIEKGSIVLADQSVEEIYTWSEAINGALYRLEEIINKQEIKLH